MFQKAPVQINVLPGSQFTAVTVLDRILLFKVYSALGYYLVTVFIYTVIRKYAI